MRWIWLGCLIAVACAQLVTDNCIQSASTLESGFLFSEVGLSCSTQGEFSVYDQLSCSGNDEFIRFGVSMLSGPPLDSSNTLVILDITSLPTPAQVCSYSDAPCSMQGGTTCQGMNNYFVDILASRLYLSFPISILPNAQYPPQGIPFSFAPIDNNTAADPVCSGFPAASCQCQITPNNANNYCGPNGPLTIYPQDAFLPSSAPVLAQCGANSDPILGFTVPELNPACSTVCCSSCGSNPATSHRRWGMGPRCELYMPGGATGDIDLNILADFVVGATTTTNFIEVNKIQTGSTTVNPGRTMRVYIDQVLKQAQEGVPLIDGLIMICYYNNSLTEPNMGPANPYTTLEPVIDLGSFNVTNPRLRQPPLSAPPSQLGIGKVPTIDSIGGDVSLFYIPAPIYNAYLDITIEHYAQSQEDVLENQLNLNTSGYVPPAQWASYTGLPGWFVPTAGGPVYVPSPCSMSNDLNAYSQLFLANYAALGNVSAALAASAPAPPWLFPNYNMGSPNWWVDGTNLLFDVSTVYPGQINLYQMFIDVPVTSGSTPYIPPLTAIAPGFALLPQSGALFRTSMDNGQANIYLENQTPLTFTEAFVFIAKLICVPVPGSFNNSDPPTFFYNGTNSLSLTSQETGFIVFGITYSPSISAPPLCNVTLSSTSTDGSIMVNQTFVLKTYAVVESGQITQQFLNQIQNNGPAPVPLKHQTALYVVSGIGFVIIVILFIVGMTVLIKECTKSSRQKQMQEKAGELQ